MIVAFLYSLSIYTTQNKFCISYKHVCNFCVDGKIETNIHLEQPFYLLTKTWKHGGSVFGTEVARGDQTVTPQM